MWYQVETQRIPTSQNWAWGHWSLCPMCLTCRHACWGSRLVPPPTVPISIDGMVQLIYKSSFVGPLASIKVIQFELPTFCAASLKKQKGKNIKLLSLRTTKDKKGGGWRPHLSTGNVDGSYNVCCVGIEATDAPSHGRAHQIFINVDLNHSLCSSL